MKTWSIVLHAPVEGVKQTGTKPFGPTADPCTGSNGVRTYLPSEAPHYKIMRSSIPHPTADVEKKKMKPKLSPLRNQKGVHIIKCNAQSYANVSSSPSVVESRQSVMVGPRGASSAIEEPETPRLYIFPYIGYLASPGSS